MVAKDRGHPMAPQPHFMARSSRTGRRKCSAPVIQADKGGERGIAGSRRTGSSTSAEFKSLTSGLQPEGPGIRNRSLNARGPRTCLQQHIAAGGSRAPHFPVPCPLTPETPEPTVRPQQFLCQLRPEGTFRRGFPSARGQDKNAGTAMPWRMTEPGPDGEGAGPRTASARAAASTPAGIVDLRPYGVRFLGISAAGSGERGRIPGKRPYPNDTSGSIADRARHLAGLTPYGGWRGGTGCKHCQTIAPPRGAAQKPTSRPTRWLPPSSWPRKA